MKRLIILVLAFAVLKVKAQQTLSEEEFISVIKKFHPVARQAGLAVRIARADVTASRAGFDPLLVMERSAKEFNGTEYYDRNMNELKIPTWYGIDLYAGRENITGSRVNPETTTGGVSYAGISFSPLQNLLMDKRRATLLQAQNFQRLSEVERNIVMNDLLQESLRSYWDWWEQSQMYELMQYALQNAEKRLGMVRTAVFLGDRAAIDTLEAITQVQSFRVKLSEVYAGLMKSRLELSAFLWTEDGGQYDLPEAVRPQGFKAANIAPLPELLQSAAVHPELVQYGYKLIDLRISRRLAFQSLLPDVKVKYNQMGYDFGKMAGNAWFNNNYRYGISLMVPLRLSEGRGEFQKAKLKIESTKLEQANKQVQLTTKLKQYYAQWQQTELQLSVQTGLVMNVAALQRGEETKFENGESSLFLVNARELKTIEAQQKEIELRSKVRKAEVDVRWAAGLLGR